MEFSVRIDGLVLDVIGRDRLEMAAGTVYFRRLDSVQSEFGERPLGFGDKIDVLRALMLKQNSLIGIVFSNRRINVKAARQFCIDLHLRRVRTFVYFRDGEAVSCPVVRRLPDRVNLRKPCGET